MVRHSNVGIKKSTVCVLLALSLCVALFRNIYMWPRPQRLGLGLDLVSGLDLGIRVLASFNITGYLTFEF